MTDLADLFRRNAASFGALVAVVPAGGWASSTPCAEWDVRALVNHVTYEQLWAPHLVDGQTVADVGDRYEGDVLGEDPLASWRAAVSGSTAAFSAPGALEGTAHLSFGDVPMSEYLIQMLTDLAVHGWDLAVAIGGDTRIDEETIDVLLPAVLDQRELIRGSGMFGVEITAGDDAGTQSRLLGLLGREG